MEKQDGGESAIFAVNFIILKLEPLKRVYFFQSTDKICADTEHLKDVKL